MGKVLQKQLKALVITYPGLYKETVARAVAAAAPVFEHVASELMQIELDYYWILHPPASHFTSPLISSVVAAGLLDDIDEGVLAKMFLRRQTRQVLIKEICASDLIAKLTEGRLEDFLLKQVIYYSAEFRRMCQCQTSGQTEGHSCADQLLRQKVKLSPQLADRLSQAMEQFNFKA